MPLRLLIGIVVASFGAAIAALFGLGPATAATRLARRR
jgi:hypothetical protein